MLRNYLTVAFRSLCRQKGYAAINILGLALGLACCLLIFQYVAYETSYDSFNANADTLYRVNETKVSAGEAPETRASSGYALGPSLAEAVPDVVRYARTERAGDPAILWPLDDPGRVFEIENVLYVDPAFLAMFSYPLVAGDASMALAEPGTVLLSQATAQQYFGDANPVGETMRVASLTNGEYRVVGVFEDVPTTSHLQFDALFPLQDRLASRQYTVDDDTGWGWYNFVTYVQLHEDADPAVVAEQGSEIMWAHQGEDYGAAGVTASLDVQPLRDVHLNDDVISNRDGAGSYRAVTFFSLVGLLTLLIALVNYVNLATARALDRAREVGVRKAVGAQRGQLMRQFLAESALTNALALGVAAVLALTLRPAVNAMADLHLTNALWADPMLWMALGVTFLTGTLLAGLYPAFVLSSFRPVAALKGKASGIGSGLWLRRSLVVLQFSASIVLVIGMTVVYNQLDHMRSADLGIDIEQVITVPAPRIPPQTADGSAMYESRAEATTAFRDALASVPAVQLMAGSYALPGQGFSFYSEVRLTAADPSTAREARMTWIDQSFAPLFGLELIAGTDFDAITAADPDGETPDPIIVTASTVRALGLTEVQDAIGQTVDMGGSTFEIVGVYGDFNWSSMHEAQENMLFGRATAGSLFSIKVAGDDRPRTLDAIETAYASVFPGNPFRYEFLDDAFDAQYRDDQRFASLFGVFAALAVLIACLGLFGLAAFTARKRTKEIGVRKVLGASVPSVLGLLSKDFAQLVAVAFVVAVPIAYWLMQAWLSDFASRITLGPSVFLFAGGLVLGLALLTVSTQALRAATTDPVRALRYE